MKFPKLLVPVLVLFAVSLSCKLLNRSGSGGLSADHLNRLAANLPTVDPNASNQPSAGAIALRRLAELEPSAATLEPEVEAVERAALKKLLAELGVRADIRAGANQATVDSQPATTTALPLMEMSSQSRSPLGPALFFLQGPEPGANSAHDAALLGGLTVSCADGPRVTAVSLPLPAGIDWVVLVPETESSTHEARAVLPDVVPRADAVFNVQRVSLLLAALGAGRADLLDLAMQDRLHQPYRRRLFPWMEEVAAAGRRAGALGCVLSGAGPCLLAAVPARGGQVVAASMAEALLAAGIAGQVLHLPVDPRGATWERLPQT